MVKQVLNVLFPTNGHTQVTDDGGSDRETLGTSGGREFFLSIRGVTLSLFRSVQRASYLGWLVRR